MSPSSLLLLPIASAAQFLKDKEERITWNYYQKMFILCYLKELICYHKPRIFSASPHILNRTCKTYFHPSSLEGTEMLPTPAMQHFQAWSKLFKNSSNRHTTNFSRRETIHSCIWVYRKQRNHHKQLLNSTHLEYLFQGTDDLR